MNGTNSLWAMALLQGLRACNEQSATVREALMQADVCISHALVRYCFIRAFVTCKVQPQDPKARPPFCARRVFSCQTRPSAWESVPALCGTASRNPPTPTRTRLSTIFCMYTCIWIYIYIYRCSPLQGVGPDGEDGEPRPSGAV